MAKILGINLSEISKKSSLKIIEEYLNQSQNISRAHFAVTPNPEIILEAQQDSELEEILNKADLSFADGFGLVIAGLILNQKIIRITGSDLSLNILELAQLKKSKVLIVNWNKGLSHKEEIAQALTNKYSSLNFKIIDVDKEVKISDSANQEIADYSPSIMFCTFGCPYQEKFIYHNLGTWPSLKFAIGVGGTFDFLTNKTKRAPIFFSQIGLEWFWRLIQQPKRLKRIYRATFLFIYKIFLHKLKS